LAAAFPESVHILAVSDLTLIAYIPRSASGLSWSGDGRRLAITPDLHYRDEGRPPRSEPLEILEEWEIDPPNLARSYALPGVPVFVAYSIDGESLVVGTVERQSDSAATDMARVPLDIAASRGLVVRRDTGALADYPISPIAAAHGFVTDGASVRGPALDSPLVSLESSLLWSPWSGGVVPAFSGDGAVLAGFLDPAPNAAAAADVGRLVVLNSQTGARLSDVASPVGPAFNLATSSDGSFVASSLGGSEDTRYYCLHER
jgi:hypothetical protein